MLHCVPEVESEYDRGTEEEDLLRRVGIHGGARLRFIRTVALIRPVSESQKCHYKYKNIIPFFNSFGSANSLSLVAIELCKISNVNFSKKKKSLMAIVHCFT